MQKYETLNRLVDKSKLLITAAKNNPEVVTTGATIGAFVAARIEHSTGNVNVELISYGATILFGLTSLLMTPKDH